MFTRLAGCGVKSMPPIFETEMLIDHPKATLDEKILFGNIPHLIDQKLGKCWYAWEQKFKIPFWPMIYLLLKFDLYFSNWRYKLQCHINHGLVWNVEVSIPIQTPYRPFSNCWVLMFCDFTKQNFLI